MLCETLERVYLAQFHVHVLFLALCYNETVQREEMPAFYTKPGKSGKPLESPNASKDQSLVSRGKEEKERPQVVSLFRPERPCSLRKPTRKRTQNYVS